MAKPPSWINKVNYVIDFWMDPCHAPFLVYLELAAAPAGDALLTWFSFGLDDVVRGYLRPSRALGSGIRTRRGKDKVKKTRWGRTVGGIGDVWRATPGLGNDVGGWIGGNLPGANELKGRRIHDLTKFLWLLDDVAQRALFWLMVADVAVDFAYEWATALNESQFCKRDKNGSLYAHGPGTAAGGILLCNTGDASEVTWQHGDCSWETTSGHVGAGNWTAVSAMKVHSNGPTPVTWWQRCVIEDMAGDITLSSNHVTIGPHGNGESVHSVGIVGPGTFVFDHCCNGGVVQPDGQDVTIFGGP